MNRLNVDMLRKAIMTLKRALDAYEGDPENEFIRDSCIQRFEYCYDLTVKMIKRHLKLTDPDPSAIEAMPFQDVIRRAYEIGIIAGGWNEWWDYRNDRAATSHGYHEDRAIAIVAKIPVFYHETETFLTRLSAFYET